MKRYICMSIKAHLHICYYLFSSARSLAINDAMIGIYKLKYGLFIWILHKNGEVGVDSAIEIVYGVFDLKNKINRNMELTSNKYSFVAESVMWFLNSKDEVKKGKAIPVTGREGTYVCETSRLPHFI
jgi:hypothetical protein